MSTVREFTDSDCPFTPGFGDAPPFLAGREREERVISRIVSRLASNAARPSGLVIYGPRGNGKTVLLDWTARLARNHGIKAIDFAAISSETEEALTRRLGGESWWTRVGRAVSWRGANRSPESLRANTVHEGLGRLVRRKPAVVLIDEAHTLGRDVGEKILKATQELNRSGAALLLVLPVRRMYRTSSIRCGRLSGREARPCR